MSAWSITVQLVITVVTAVALVLIVLRLNLCLQYRRTRSALRCDKVQLMIGTRLDSSPAVETCPDSGTSGPHGKDMAKPIRPANREPEGVPQIPVKTSETGNATTRARNNRSEPGARNGSPSGSKAKSTRARPIPVKPDDDYYDTSDGTDSLEADTVITSELVDERDREPGLEFDDRIEVEVR